MRAKFEVVRGDITRSRVDAIVNAANPSLLGGGGVSGAIYRVAGPQLTAACRQVGPCQRGDARITAGFGLPAHYVIHTPGPVCQGGGDGEPRILAACYRKSLELAAATRCRTVDFCSISTGIYGYPMDRAASVAVRTIDEFLATNPGTIRRVRMVAYDRVTEQAYEQALSASVL
jgi:O-acetyl-ADP-ribose deacetylase (regulator of RNase III)